MTLGATSDILNSRAFASVAPDIGDYDAADIGQDGEKKGTEKDGSWTRLSSWLKPR